MPPNLIKWFLRLLGFQYLMLTDHSDVKCAARFKFGAIACGSR